MTESQYLHHAEQMESARAEFGKFWEDELLPHIRRSVNLSRAVTEITVTAQAAAWRAFLHGKGIK